MSMLNEKRQELVIKLANLEQSRKAEIDAKVEAYRVSLEETIKYDGIDKLKSVIAAIDEVIAYDDTVQKQAQVQVQHNVARPGMADILTPSRQ